MPSAPYSISSLGEKRNHSVPEGPVIYGTPNRRTVFPTQPHAADVCPGTICTNVALNSLPCPQLSSQNFGDECDYKYLV